MTLTQEQTDFLHRLSKSGEGKHLISIYEAELRELDVKLRTAKGEAIYQTQGRAQQLDEMIERIKGTTAAKPQALTRVVASRGFGE